MKPYNYEKAVKSYQYQKKVEQGQIQHYSSTYKTTRLVTKIISYVGWVIIGLSSLSLLGSILEGGIKGGFILPICLVFAVLGLVLVIQGQLTRATVDNADSNAEMLAIMKSAYEKDKSENSENPKA